MSKAVFKTYSTKEAYLIPPSWDEKIKKDHPVRIVSTIVESLDLKNLYSSYQGGGSSSYDPKMLLKAIIYSYINNIFSSRKIEEAIKSNIHLIWLCGNNEPDHNTINRFRSNKMQEFLKDIFRQIVLLLVEEGLLSLKEIYVDGTKFEANANHNSFVWGKSIKTSKERMIKQIDELWQYTQQLAGEELKDTEPLDFKTIDKDKITKTIEAIEESIKDKPIPKTIQKKLNYVKKNYPDKLEEYKAKEEILAGRNSYSKSDHGSTFMRMKDDHMGNGQLKAGYNLQISTNNQIITNYDIYSNPTDTLTFPSHIESFKKLYNVFPNTITADSGYGSDQNYKFLEDNQIGHFVKFNYFHQEQRGIRLKKYPFVADHLYYNKDLDYYVCPIGQRMDNIGSSKQINESGFEQTITRYQALNCKGCPMNGKCHKGKGNRIIEINHRLNHFKQKARENLTSQEGIKHRKQRPHDVESVFGNIKQNKNFKRFTLRGAKKVAVEFGFIAIAHNLQKYFA